MIDQDRPAFTSEDFRISGVKAAELDGAANRLEKHEKILLSEMVNHYRQNGGAISAAEHAARADPRYKTHVDEMVSARTLANVAKAETEAIRMKYEIWRTVESTKRAEMKHLNQS